MQLFFLSLFLVFFSSLKLGSLIELMCKKNVINAKLMAGSNLISALNAQRAPHGGGGGDDDGTSQRLSSGKKKAAAI